MIILAENVLEVEYVISMVAETDTTGYYMVTKLDICISFDHRIPSLNQPSISKPEQTKRDRKSHQAEMIKPLQIEPKNKGVDILQRGMLTLIQLRSRFRRRKRGRYELFL